MARCRPGVTEYQLKAAAAGAILEGGGDLDFAIIGSPMKNPALIFGNPRPSGRALKDGDIVIMELAAGYRGTARRSARRSVSANRQQRYDASSMRSCCRASSAWWIWREQVII